MKKKFSRILGVALTIVVLVSLMVGGAAPVSAAALGWTAVTLPATGVAGGWVIGPVGANIVRIAVSPDGGTLWAVDNSAAPFIYISTDGGYKWTAATTIPAGMTVPTAIAVSPTYATDKTLYAGATVGGAGTLYKSTNGGVTWIQAATGIAGEVITSIALSPIHANDGLVIVGTTAAGGAAYGTVYQIGVPNTFGLAVATPAAPLVADVTAVAFSPKYPTDRTIVAVGSRAAALVGPPILPAGTSVSFNVNFAGWNASIWSGVVNTAVTIAPLILDTGSAAGITSSALALPRDFDGSLVAGRIAWVTTVSATPANDQVWRVNNTAPGAWTATDIITGNSPGFSELAYDGTLTAGTLVAGLADVAGAGAGVSRLATPLTATGTAVWTAATTAPTGVGPTRIALAPDFATSKKVYAGTSGAGALPDAAVSVSADGAVSFYQTGLINMDLAGIGFITSVVPSPDNKDLFMVTADSNAVIAGVSTAVDFVEGLWKTSDGGAKWTRVLTLETPNDTAIVRPSPAYATDKTVYFVGTGVGATAIFKSTDNGATWVQYSALAGAPGGIGDLLVQDAVTIYVGDAAAGTVSKSAQSGWIWETAKVVPDMGAAIASLALSSNNHILVGGAAGDVGLSTDNGTTYVSLNPAGIGAGLVVLAFDSAYATNKTVYAASNVAAGSIATAGGQVQRWVVGTSTAWTDLTTTPAMPVTATVGPIVGLIAGAGGVLYAADSTAAAALDGGILRTLNPTAAVSAANPTWEWVSADAATGTKDDLTAAYTLVSLSAAGNTLYAIENSRVAPANLRVMTYTDTLVTATVAGSVTSTLGGANTDWTWTFPTGATGIDIQYDTRTDFRTAVTGTAAAFAALRTPLTTVTSLQTVIGAVALTPGTTYNWQMRVARPVLGPWSTAKTFVAILPTPETIAVLPNLTPARGEMDISVRPTFFWPAVANATYVIMVAEDRGVGANFDILDFSANTDANIYVVPESEALSYSTTYYWRVRAITATTNSTWTVSSFTTMAEPVPPAAPVEKQVIVTQPGEIKIVQVPVEKIVPQAIPSYMLWLIIGIGAVLIIALIILIVRTRRVT